MACLLRDVEIEALLKASPSLVVNFDTLLDTDNSPVKGSSLDLQSGIFLSGSKSE